MQFDYERYRHHLQGHNFSREQENDIMDLMWKTMSAAAEKAWWLSPVNNIEQENSDFTLRESITSLDSKEISIQHTFKKETVAPPPERIH